MPGRSCTYGDIVGRDERVSSHHRRHAAFRRGLGDPALSSILLPNGTVALEVEEWETDSKENVQLPDHSGECWKWPRRGHLTVCQLKSGRYLTRFLKMLPAHGGVSNLPQARIFEGALLWPEMKISSGYLLKGSELRALSSTFLRSFQGDARQD